MKNEFHLAYRASFNYPLHIASPDSVKAHMRDDVRLISMLPVEFPKVRGRDVCNNLEVKETSNTGGVKIQRVEVNIGEEIAHGFLVNDKYYFSRDVASYIPSFELLFKSFKENKIKPMVRREWSWDYPSSNPFWYTLVDETTEEYYSVEPFFDINGWELHGIDCLADLLSQSYKFSWDHVKCSFETFTDPHDITKRIRKPWMTHLIQIEYGEAPQINGDDHKVISFLMQKVESLLSHDEKNAMASYLSNRVELDTLERLNQRNIVLNDIIKAYNDPALLVVGETDALDDPIINYQQRLYARGEHGRYTG